MSLWVRQSWFFVLHVKICLPDDPETGNQSSIQQEDRHPGEEALDIHGEFNGHGANDANALKQGNPHVEFFGWCDVIRSVPIFLYLYLNVKRKVLICSMFIGIAWAIQYIIISLWKAYTLDSEERYNWTLTNTCRVFVRLICKCPYIRHAVTSGHKIHRLQILETGAFQGWLYYQPKQCTTYYKPNPSI